MHSRGGGGGNNHVGASPLNTTTTTTSTATAATTTTSVDDAKYDRRIKQRLLLRSQRQRRRQEMMLDCRQLCIRVCLMTALLITILYYATSYIFIFTAISSSTSTWSDPSSLVHRGMSPPQALPLPLPQPQRLPPLEQQQQHQQQQQQEIEQQVLPSTASLDLQYQQLRLLFLPSTNNHQFRNNDVLSDVRSSSQIVRQKKQLIDVLESWLNQEDLEIQNNLGSTQPRYIRPYLLPPLNDRANNNGIDDTNGIGRRMNKLRKNSKLPYIKASQLGKYFRVFRFPPSNNNNNNPIQAIRNILKHQVKQRNTDGDDEKGDDEQTIRTNEKISKNPMKWQDEYDELLQKYGARDRIPGPAVDYADASLYTYPTRIAQPPMDGTYPNLQPLQQLLRNWPQNEDYNVATSGKIRETLQHFDYQNPQELKMALQYRDAELPFKLYNIPDITAATPKWKSDEYVGRMFGNGGAVSQAATITDAHGQNIHIPTARGTAQESRNHYFAFYVSKQWDVETMGLAPTRNIQDWNYTIWSNHAIYADAVRLTPDRPHFYWQSGVAPEERHESSKHWTFISRDLPIFSTATDNFFVFHVDEQKGIQCRFGERGVVAATHFDSGRNMVAMINGAKRYILSPPNQCSKLGIFKSKRSPIYRHSLLDFGHIQYLEQAEVDEEATEIKGKNSSIPQPKMSPEERAWLQRAASSRAVETVLKQGEVLYIPSHWFHYIVSLQKSAQCNVRSGIDIEGTHIFGGRKDVDACTE